MNDKEQKILETLKTKSLTKQNLFGLMQQTFERLKELLNERADLFNKQLLDFDKRLLLEVKERGPFEMEVKIAGDILIFQMHTNVFQFYRSHHVWQTSYLRNNILASYAGMINVFNFLADSFTYKRTEDLGYLIARIFINKDKHFFVEGKRQLGMMYNNFGERTIDDNALREIIDTAILYSLEFDLLVPLYDEMKIISVSQIEQNLENSKIIKTGKRLGFQFYADDTTNL
jgi:hypothetical protein